jgi:molecular chaperone DnaK
VDVSVAEFEERTRDLLMQTQNLLEQVVEDAEKQHGITKDRIEVMLTGGSSKMPMVRKMIESVMGRPPLQHRNPELLVTIGAAYRAYLLQEGNTVLVGPPDDDGRRKELQINNGGLVDTSLYAIGVEVLRPNGKGDFDAFNSVIVPAGANYGAEFKKEFRTSTDNMMEVPVTLYKGDSPAIADCEPLMTFTITGLPPNLAKGTRVDVTLGYDSSGILNGTAVIETGQQVAIVVDRSKF